MQNEIAQISSMEMDWKKAGSEDGLCFAPRTEKPVFWPLVEQSRFVLQSEGYEDADELMAQRIGILPPMKASGPIEIEPARVVTTSNNECMKTTIV